MRIPGAAARALSTATPGGGGAADHRSAPVIPEYNLIAVGTAGPNATVATNGPARRYRRSLRDPAAGSIPQAAAAFVDEPDAGTKAAPASAGGPDLAEVGGKRDRGRCPGW